MASLSRWIINGGLSWTIRYQKVGTVVQQLQAELSDVIESGLLEHTGWDGTSFSPLHTTTFRGPVGVGAH